MGGFLLFTASVRSRLPGLTLVHGVFYELIIRLRHDNESLPKIKCCVENKKVGGAEPIQPIHLQLATNQYDMARYNNYVGGNTDRTVYLSLNIKLFPCAPLYSAGLLLSKTDASVLIGNSYQIWNNKSKPTGTKILLPSSA